MKYKCFSHMTDFNVTYAINTNLKYNEILLFTCLEDKYQIFDSKSYIFKTLR